MRSDPSMSSAFELLHPVVGEGLLDGQLGQLLLPGGGVDLGDFKELGIAEEAFLAELGHLGVKTLEGEDLVDLVLGQALVLEPVVQLFPERLFFVGHRIILP